MAFASVRQVGVASSLALALGLAAPGADAETLAAQYHYNVKAVCSVLATFDDFTLAKGVYRTLINIGNPSDEPVGIAIKPVVAGTFASADSITSAIPRRQAVPPHGAVSIDCGTIIGFFCPTADGLCFDFGSLDGFVKIHATDAIDVVAIYTARPSEGEVSTMDLETVEGREMAREIEVQDVEEPPAPEPRMRMRSRLEAE